MNKILIPLVILALAQAAAAEPFQAWKGDDIPWQSRRAQRDALCAAGRRSRQARAVHLCLFHPGRGSGTDRTGTARPRVSSWPRGRLSIGDGDTPDHSQARRYPAGSYVVVPGGRHHFDGADEDTVIIGVAAGPWSTTYVDGFASRLGGDADPGLASPQPPAGSRSLK